MLLTEQHNNISKVRSGKNDSDKVSVGDEKAQCLCSHEVIAGLSQTIVDVL